MNTTRTNTGLVDFVQKQLGSPYWYGTFGRVATQAILNTVAGMYPSHYTTSRMSTYRSQLGRRTFDCIGLIKAYLWTGPSGNVTYTTSEDWNADTTLARCQEKGLISTMPDLPGTLVFFPGHVGVYIGNGQVIEAQGFAHGVVRTQLRSRPWRHWGKHPLITYQAAGPSLEINGRKVTTQIKNEGGRIFALLDGEGNQKHWVQIRALNDLLGGSLAWDQSTQTARMTIR